MRPSTKPIAIATEKFRKPSAAPKSLSAWFLPFATEAERLFHDRVKLDGD